MSFEVVLRQLSEILAGAPPVDAAAAEALLERAGILLQRCASEPPAECAAHAWSLRHREQTWTVATRFLVSDEGMRATLSNLVCAVFERVAERRESVQTRERMELLSSAAFEGILVHLNGAVIAANHRVAEMFGYERPEDMLGSAALPACVAPEDLAGIMQRFARGEETEHVFTGVRRDGSHFRVAVQSRQSRLGDQPVRVAAVRDVTERERTSLLLRESEARLRDLAEQAFDFVTISRDGCVLDVLGPVERVLGIGKEQLIGRSILDVTAPSSLPLAREVVAERRHGNFEVTVVAADGECIPLALVVANSTLNGQPVRVSGARDLRQMRKLQEERRKLEQQLQRMQRLESLGVLAGGIAHDFNNLLVGILGNAELLIDRVSSGFDRDAVAAIVAAGRRAADLTSSMLAYAGQRDLGRRQPVDLGALCRELTTLLGATISKKARIEFDLAPNLLVSGDRASLTQLLMNILTNASDALEDRAGDICVRVARLTRPDARWDHALGATVSPGEWVLLEVRDTGMGMDEATRERAFEPFFSTKQKGHGLGLASCLGIVSAHRGALLVESVPHEGTCFSVLMPAATEASAAQRVEDPAELSHGTALTVLVVDDEDLVRAQLRRSLELRGYQVEEAVDGRNALVTLERTSPDVIILDLTMPDMDGAEVARLLHERGSRVPVVLSSGYADIGIERRLDRAAFHSFLHKPFGAQELVEAIERALTAARAQAVTA